MSLGWQAFSRGLQIHLAPPGLSPHTFKELSRLQIPLHHTAPERQSLTIEDLSRAHRAIALQHTEHFPMMQEQFPEYADKIEYWEVLDIEYADPSESLELIARQVHQMLDALRTSST